MVSWLKVGFNKDKGHKLLWFFSERSTFLQNGGHTPYIAQMDEITEFSWISLPSQMIILMLRLGECYLSFLYMHNDETSLWNIKSLLNNKTSQKYIKKYITANIFRFMEQKVNMFKSVLVKHNSPKQVILLHHKQ